MKSLVLALSLLLSFTASAKCLVELLDESETPLQTFSHSNCAVAKANCQAALRRLNREGLQCEVTMDVGPGKANPTEVKTSIPLSQ